MPRLIDADKLKKDVLDLPDCYNGFSDTYDKACIIGVIDEQPTIEPKKGKWKEEIDTGERMLACSACGGRVFLETYETAVGEHGYRFCPYCGAQMER